MYKNANVDIDEEWIKSVTEGCNELINEFVSTETSNSTVGALREDESHNNSAFHENISCNSTKPLRAESDSVSVQKDHPLMNCMILMQRKLAKKMLETLVFS